MAKLKLNHVPDDKPVRLTSEFPAPLHRDLLAYAELLSRETGAPALEPAKLVPHMVARFMASDRAFAKAKRNVDTGTPPRNRDEDQTPPSR